MFFTTVFLSFAFAIPEQSENQITDKEKIGVWTFDVVSSDDTSVNTPTLQLEEMTRQEMLPLLQQNSDLHLVTPENMTIEGSISGIEFRYE